MKPFAKHIRPLALIVAFSFLFLLPMLLASEMIVTHDGPLHIARIGAYYKSFIDGQIPPRWASDLNYSYGTPLFIFYYPIPGFLGSLLYAFGFSLEQSFTTLLAVSFLISPLGFYLWIKRHVCPSAALAGCLLYGLAPYHFLDLYVRGAVGELFALALAPFILLTIDKLNEKKGISILIGGVLYGLLILSHNAFALVFTILLVAYAFYFSSKLRQTAVKAGGMIILGLGLSAFFWIPAIAEQKYTHAKLSVFRSKYSQHFPRLSQLLYSPWGFGTDVTKPRGLSPQIGLVHIGVTVLALITIVVVKHRDRAIIFWLAIFCFAVFLSLPISELLWARLRTLSSFEFPWRFTALSSFAASVLGALIAAKQPQWLAMLVIILLVATSVPLTKVAGYMSRPDSYYLSFPGSTEFGAATTIWSAGDPYRYPSKAVEIISGDGVISNSLRRSRQHSLRVRADTDLTMVDNTLYFPGWRVYVDGVKVPIEFQNAFYRGLITFSVPKGRHQILVQFGESPVRMLANILSLVAGGWLAFALVRRSNYAS